MVMGRRRLESPGRRRMMDRIRTSFREIIRIRKIWWNQTNHLLNWFNNHRKTQFKIKRVKKCCRDSRFYSSSSKCKYNNSSNNNSNSNNRWISSNSNNRFLSHNPNNTNKALSKNNNNNKNNNHNSPRPNNNKDSTSNNSVNSTSTLNTSNRTPTHSNTKHLSAKWANNTPACKHLLPPNKINQTKVNTLSISNSSNSNSSSSRERTTFPNDCEILQVLFSLFYYLIGWLFKTRAIWKKPAWLGIAISRR